MAVHFAVDNSNKRQGFGCIGDQTLAVVGSYWGHEHGRPMEVQLANGEFVAVSLNTTFNDLRANEVMGNGSVHDPFVIRIEAAGETCAMTN